MRRVFYGGVFPRHIKVRQQLCRSLRSAFRRPNFNRMLSRRHKFGKVHVNRPVHSVRRGQIDGKRLPFIHKNRSFGTAAR